MAETSFSLLIEAALRNAGWHPERRLSLEEMKSWCAIHDAHEQSLPLVISPVAYSTLQEFGGLKVTFGEGGMAQILNFDPLEAITYWFEYGWIVGQPIFPLAIYHHVDDETNYVKIGIDTTGKIWLKAYDLYFISQNLHEAIEYLGAHFDAPQPFDTEDFEVKGDEADQLRTVIKDALRFTS